MTKRPRYRVGADGWEHRYYHTMAGATARIYHYSVRGINSWLEDRSSGTWKVVLPEDGESS